MRFEELRGLLEGPVTVSCCDLGYLVTNDDSDTLIDAYGEKTVVGISVCTDDDNRSCHGSEFELAGNILVKLE